MSQGCFFPDWLELRRRVDKALYAVVMEAYTGGIFTRKVDALVKAFLSRPLEHARVPYTYHDATYLHGRLGQNIQVVSRAIVVAIGNRYAEAQGIQRARLPRGAPHCRGRQPGRGLQAEVGAWPDWNQNVILDAHLGLTAAIERMFQGRTRRRTAR